MCCWGIFAPIGGILSPSTPKDLFTWSNPALCSSDKNLSRFFRCCIFQVTTTLSRASVFSVAVSSTLLSLSLKAAVNLCKAENIRCSQDFRLRPIDWSELRKALGERWRGGVGRVPLRCLRGRKESDFQPREEMSLFKYRSLSANYEQK